ncbi:MAG: 3-deoxy-7-phosphoheptulonate synthase [Bacilli bacterium]|nr:3-deoxy-7-phosphoheptulonate synthase [Bacilli bacterium]
MILVMKSTATEQEIKETINYLEQRGVRVNLSKGEQVTVIGLIGDKRVLQELPVESLPGVDRCVHVTHPFKLASRDFHPDNTIVHVGNIEVGGEHTVIMAGPCSVESR